MSRLTFCSSKYTSILLSLHWQIQSYGLITQLHKIPTSSPSCKISLKNHQTHICYSPDSQWLSAITFWSRNINEHLISAPYFIEEIHKLLKNVELVKSRTPESVPPDSLFRGLNICFLNYINYCSLLVPKKNIDLCYYNSTVYLEYYA